MSANLVVDLGPTTLSLPSLPGANGMAITSGGTISSLSGALIGDVVDLLQANTFCNVYVAGRSLGSGPLIVGVQCSPTDASGSFTDPTSGLAQIPPPFVSGGRLVIGSGPATAANLGIFGSGVSGQMVLSGFHAFAAFQRPARYARLVTAAGFMDVTAFQAGFVSQLKTVGSGGGFSWSPQSGNTVQV